MSNKETMNGEVILVKPAYTSRYEERLQAISKKVNIKDEKAVIDFLKKYSSASRPVVLAMVNTLRKRANLLPLRIKFKHGGNQWFLSLPSEEKIWEAIKSNKNSLEERIMLALLFPLGLRASEVVGIKFDDFVVQNDGSVYLRIKGKFGKDRKIMVPNWLWKMVKEFWHNEMQKEQRHPWNMWNKIKTRNSVNYFTKKLVGTTPRALRHLTATVLLNVTDIWTTKEWLGHTSMTATAKYLHAPKFQQAISHFEGKINKEEKETKKNERT